VTFSQTEIGSNPQTIHCRNAGTFTELFSLKHSSSVNAKINFFKKKTNQLSFSSDLSEKNSFYKILKALLQKSTPISVLIKPV